MHNAALAELARKSPALGEWRYFRFDIEAEKLVEALPLFHQKGFLGLNLTVPHKEVAFELVSEIDPAAHRIGAVNTLRRSDSGYRGYNTDGYGLSEGIREALGMSLIGARITLLGAGGAARAAAMQCIEEGCASLMIFNRNPQRLAALMETLRPFATAKGVALTGAAPGELDLPSSDCLLINATSLGLKESDPAPFPANASHVPHLCYDMIYNPPQTKLMRLVESNGGRSANGLSMLVHQGAKALEIWSGATPPVSTMRQAALEALNLH